MSTLGTLATNVSMKLGDSGNFTSADFYTVSNVKRAIGDSYKYYIQQMVKLGDGYFETTTDLNLTANTENISLSSLSPPFWFCSQLWRYITNGRIPLRPNQGRYKTNITKGAGVKDSYLPEYSFRGTDLILMPRPGISETAALKLDYVYIPTFPTSSSANSFDFNTETSGITSTGFQTIYEANVELRALIKLLYEKEAAGGIVDWQTHKTDLTEMDEIFLKTIQRNEDPEEIDYFGVDYANI